MTLEWSSSINKPVTFKNQLFLPPLPNSLQQAIETAMSQHYEELYEEESDGSILLEEALIKVLNSFQSDNNLLTQLRYVWMALILVTLVEPTIKYYQPNNSIPEKTINRLMIWLLMNITEFSKSRNQSNRYSQTDVDYFSSIDKTNFSVDREIPSLQILSEALDVYINATKLLEPDYSLQILLDILDNCLEGYAIIPGSEGRRKLFDWWLEDVVPSVWYLHSPTSVGLLNELTGNDYNSVFSRLNNISDLMRKSLMN
ncbi:hypothetical protein H6G23_15735 [Desertifilum sp. FACHB-866]|nr:hypothetical protein [Desertifilum sp. FACHB-866]